MPESADRFPRTPMAGDMTATRAVITFHVADDSAATLRVWTADGIVVDHRAPPTGDGFHKVTIDGLSPGTTYRYAAFGGEGPAFADRGLIGTFRTAPDDDALVPVRIALIACIGQGTVLPDYYMPPTMASPTAAPFQWDVFRHAADHDLDALIHLGDQAYLDFVWTEQDGALDAYLEAWGYYHGGGYRDVYPLAGLYATWDDHEAADNAFFDPWDLTQAEQAKLDNAHTAWFKVMPIDAAGPGPVWRSFRWGQTLQLVLLDCRYELDEDHLMSAAQLDWLIETVSDSPCRFVCIATPKPFAAIASSEPLAEDNAGRWEGFPADRARLVERLDALAAKHVIFVAGDIHMNYLGRAGPRGRGGLGPGVGGLLHLGQRQPARGHPVAPISSRSSTTVPTSRC